MSETIIEPEKILNDNAMVPVLQPATVVLANPSDIALAIETYVKVQRVLDKALPDCLMTIRGKQFRKKNYWRAVATAFNLTVSKVDEHLDQPDDAGDWGYIVTYRAMAPNGRFADGDGSCFSSEKAEGQNTAHNVRAHAHTRAYNRAVSNLVGFGEVSAEEMMDSGRGAPNRQVSGAGPALGGMSATAPRPVSARSAPIEKPAPVSLDGSWLDEPVGFGKYKDKTWRHMSEGDFGGQRHSYCQWIVATPSKYPGDEEKKRRAQAVIDSLQATTVAVNPEADAAPRSDGWNEEQPPIPNSEWDK